MMFDDAPETEARLSFGAWLLTHKNDTGPVAELAKIAATDRAFPRAGTPDDVRKHLNAAQADPMLFEVVGDAETDWLDS